MSGSGFVQYFPWSYSYICRCYIMQHCPIQKLQSLVPKTIIWTYFLFLKGILCSIWQFYLFCLYCLQSQLSPHAGSHKHVSWNISHCCVSTLCWGLCRLPPREMPHYKTTFNMCEYVNAFFFLQHSFIQESPIYGGSHSLIRNTHKVLVIAIFT